MCVGVDALALDVDGAHALASGLAGCAATLTSLCLTGTGHCPRPPPDILPYCYFEDGCVRQGASSMLRAYGRLAVDGLGTDTCGRCFWTVRLIVCGFGRAAPVRGQ